MLALRGPGAVGHLIAVSLPAILPISNTHVQKVHTRSEVSLASQMLPGGVGKSTPFTVFL